MEVIAEHGPLTKYEGDDTVVYDYPNGRVKCEEGVDRWLIMKFNECGKILFVSKRNNKEDAIEKARSYVKDTTLQ